MKIEILEIYPEELVLKISEHIVSYEINSIDEYDDEFDNYYGHNSKYTGRYIIEELVFKKDNEISEEEIKTIVNNNMDYNDYISEVIEKANDRYREISQ